MKERLRVGMPCAVTRRGGIPEIVGVCGRALRVVEVEARWCTWQVPTDRRRGDATDLELWRIRTGPPNPYVIILDHDLAAGSWRIRSVWD